MKWREILARALDDLGSVAAVSRAICGSERLRPRLSMALNGRYFGSEKDLERLVLDRFARIRCPFIGAEIPHAECAEHRAASCPTSSPRAMRHWRACQACLNHKEVNDHADNHAQTAASARAGH